MAHDDLIQFEAFYRKHHPSLIAFARYFLKSESDAEEVVNDVFLNIWDKRDVLILDESLKPYLFQSTKNRAFNQLKKNKQSFMQLEEEEQLSIAPDVLTNLEEKENDERMQMLLYQLPPRCQQVFSMSRIDDLSNKEIAELLDISVKTVENQMTKALKFFRKNLKVE